MAISLVEDIAAIGILKELFDKERSALTHFLDSLNLGNVYKILECLNDCKGLIVLTGVGKSGFVAEKIASTMTSTGTKALFISPTNALHGDLGIIHQGDVFVIFSKSDPRQPFRMAQFSDLTKRVKFRKTGLRQDNIS